MLRNRNLRYYNYFIKQKPVKYNNYSKIDYEKGNPIIVNYLLNNYKS